MEQSSLDEFITEVAAMPVTLPAIEEILGRLGDTTAAAAADRAEESGEACAAVRILLAGLLRGEAPAAGRVARLLPFVADIRVALLLMSRAEGDRVTEILEVCKSGRLSEEREAAMLFLATEILGSEPAPALLKIRLRLLSRKHLGPEASLMLGAAAGAIGDEDVEVVAASYIELAGRPGIDAIVKRWREAISLSVTEVLPELPPEDVEGGYTIQRDAPKVGRNDPCSCGSGRKYKKCCGKPTDRPLPSSVAPRQRRSPYRPTMTSEQFYDIRAMDLARLDPRGVAPEHLVFLIRQLALYGFWEPAERAVEELSRRGEDDPSLNADGHRYDFFYEALQAKQMDLARRQAAALPEELFDDLRRLALDLAESKEDRLARLEAKVREGLEDPDEPTLTELAFALLASVPALGILVTRGVLEPRRDFDAWALLETIEEARDRLLLPPDDPAWDLYDALVDLEGERRTEKRREVLDEKLAEEVRDLREKVAWEGARARELKQKLEEKERAAAKVASPAQPRSPTLPAERPPPPAPADPELAKRIEELKTLLKASNHEKAKLRRQLSGASRRVVAEEATHPEKDADRPPTYASPEDLEEAAATPERLSLLLPVWGKRFESSLRALPESLARDVLARAAALAGGTPSAWVGAKRMKAAPEIRTTRLGHAHRLLFRIDPDAGRLEALEAIHRKDLDAALRRYRP